MANADIRKGLVPVDHQILKGYCGKSRPYYVPATYAVALYVGDPVLVTGTSNTANILGHKAGALPEINLATAGDGNYIAGVITGFDLPLDGNTPFSANNKPASKEAVVWVNDDPYTIFEIQADSANAVAETDISSNANIVYTHSGSGAYSGCELNTASMTTTYTYQLRILGLVERADNALGINAKLLVRINKHFYAPITPGI